MAIAYTPRLTIITSVSEAAANSALVEAFWKEYVSDDHFPDEEEREDPEVVQSRIQEQSSENSTINPYTHLVCLELRDEKAADDGKKKFKQGCPTACCCYSLRLQQTNRHGIERRKTEIRKAATAAVQARHRWVQRRRR